MNFAIARKVSPHFRHWPVAIALPLFALVLSYYEYLFIDAPFVWWARSTFYAAPKFALCLVPVSLLIVFLWFFRLIIQEPSPVASLRSAGLCLVLLIFVNVNMCVATVFTVFGDYRHHDTERLGHHVYRLDSEWKVGVGSASQAYFSLLECDPSGLICKLVYGYRYVQEGDTSYIDIAKYQAVDASLQVDSENENISVEIDGQTIYTYPP